MARSHPVDVHVGARMRQRRTLLGMSQEKLGTAVGLTFQQIQKYERGSNRIGSSRLFEFAKVLDVPVSYFFDEMPSNALSGRPMSGRGRKGFGEAGTPFEQEKDPLIKRETLELVRAYYKTRTPPVAVLGYIGYNSILWGTSMAAATLITLPVLVLSLCVRQTRI